MGVGKEERWGINEGWRKERGSTGKNVSFQTIVKVLVGRSSIYSSLKTHYARFNGMQKSMQRHSFPKRTFTICLFYVAYHSHCLNKKRDS